MSERRLFHTITYPAVIEGPDGRPAPLWPRETVGGRDVGFTLEMLAEARSLAGGEDVWETTWMQRALPGASVFCSREMIWGDRDQGYPGILDFDRLVGEPAAGFEGALRVVSVDPAPENMAAMICADIPPSFPYRAALIDIHRRKIPSHAFMHLLADWHARYRFTELIVEENQAGPLLRVENLWTWMQQAGVRYRPHRTERNKAHDLYGEGTIPADIKEGRIRIPWGDEVTRALFKPLVDELLERIDTRDCRMALWFPKWQIPFLGAGLELGGWHRSVSPPHPAPGRLVDRWRREGVTQPA